jgi:hypothetical protein
MQPSGLSAKSFRSYPPLARKLACDHLALLRELPLPLAAILLREAIKFDTRFPREQAAIMAQFDFLASLPADKLHRLTQGFATLSLPPALTAEDWVNAPQKFEEGLSAHLWASHQIDAFHTISTQLMDAMQEAAPPPAPPSPRWAAVVLGPELRNDAYPLFRKLRPHGVFFSHVERGGGMGVLLDRLATRASQVPVPYGHWYIDGGVPLPGAHSGVSSFSWSGSSPLREALLNRVQKVIGSGRAGPEMLTSVMAAWSPDRHTTRTGDPLMDDLVLSVYAEGSGTQIFSTTFVQWASRELLRRAEPVSLVACYGPRQRERDLNEMFAKADANQSDPAGSLVDADLGAYYTWINLARLRGSESASFLAWSESHGQAVAIGPNFPRATEAPDSIALEKVLHMSES